MKTITTRSLGNKVESWGKEDLAGLSRALDLAKRPIGIADVDRLYLIISALFGMLPETKRLAFLEAMRKLDRTHRDFRHGRTQNKLN